MKSLKKLSAVTLMAAFLAAPFAGLAGDATPADTKKPKPYPLKKCVVSDEELGGMGKPYVFVREGQEVKLCCKSCLKDFNKAPAKYMKKIEEANAKAKPKA